MTETLITVQGSAWAELAPDRCEVQFSVAAEGTERSAVVASVTETVDAVRTRLEGLEQRGTVTRWSIDRVHVSSQRPWTGDGTRGPVEHRAHVGGVARLHDVDEVSALVDMLASLELAQIDALEWTLDDDRLDRERAEVRRRAIGDALRKAEDYAAALGLGDVTAVALADPGMLDGSGAGSPAPRFEKAMMAMDARAAGGLTLQPALMRLEAAVDARFSAH